MVQQANNLKMMSGGISDGKMNQLNEFQYVHAQITQAPPQIIYGCDDPKENLKKKQQQQQHMYDDDVTGDVSTICGKFQQQSPHNNNSNYCHQIRKRVIPTYKKAFTTRHKSPHEHKIAECSTPQQQPADKKDDSDSSDGGIHHCHIDELDVIGSNVQDKVQHFEQLQQLTTSSDVANAVPPPLPQAAAAFQNRNVPRSPSSPAGLGDSPEFPAEDELLLERRADDVTNNTSQQPSASQQQHPQPIPPPPLQPPEQPALVAALEQQQQVPVQLTGRNLKRVPSERFQEMRKKVQRLMCNQEQGYHDDRMTSTTSTLDENEESFLQSIRMVLPSLNMDPCIILRLPDHVLCNIFGHLGTRTLAALKMTCSDFQYVINFYDVRAVDSRWTADKRYIEDPCKQCRRHFTRGDQTMCRYHPKRYYSDLPYGRSYWMCCLKVEKSADGCATGLHDNRWLAKQQHDDEHVGDT